jgi:hypothetical protein
MERRSPDYRHVSFGRRPHTRKCDVYFAGDSSLSTFLRVQRGPLQATIGKRRQECPDRLQKKLVRFVAMSSIKGEFADSSTRLASRQSE